MNCFVCMGRLTADPEIKYSQDNLAIARFTVAVNRMKKGEADFFNCTAFGKRAEFVGKYLTKGSRVMVRGQVHIDSYTNKDGQKAKAINVNVDEVEFAESKGQGEPKETPKDDGFMKIPDNISDEDLPFN